MNPPDVQPHTVTFPDSSTLKSCSIDPTDYVAATLMRELSQGWRESSVEFQLSASTVSGRATSIRAVGRFLTDESDRFLTLHSDGPEVANRLHDWETAMVAKYPAESKQPKMLGYDVRIAVSHFLQTNDLANGVIADWADSPVLDGRPLIAAPLDEFSNDERQQLESACRQIVRDTEDRLAHGDRLLAMGRDPRRFGWDRLENVAWALRWLPFDESFSTHLIAGGKRQLDPTEVDQLSGVYRDPTRINKPPLVSAVGAFLVPDPEFLLAVRILLHLQTGWSPEESADLTRADIKFASDSVRVKAVKARAHRVRWHTVRSSEARPWGWTAGDLLRRAANAMRHAHALTPKEPAFWITAAKCSNRRNGEYPNWLIRAHTFSPAIISLGKIVQRRGLAISEPHDMRRLRKTVKSARAVLLGTLSGAAGDDHTVEVFRQHYAQSTTVRTISAQTVIRVQQKVLQNAISGPALVTATAEDIAETGDGDQKLVELARQVASETSVEQQLTVSACVDPYEGPFTQQGTLCHASPSMCLQCRNAVVFPEHLPRLLAYDEVLQSLEKDLPPKVYSEVYGQQTVNVRAIIARFDSKVVESARGRMQLHRPLGQRAEQ